MTTTTASLQALVALDDEVDRGLVETLVSGGSHITVLDYLELGASTASGYGAGDVLLVACSDFRPEVGEYVAEAARQHPSRPVVLLCPSGTNGYVGEAFEHGVDDVIAIAPRSDQDVDPEQSRQLAFALEKAVIRRRGVPKDSLVKTGRMVCVLGLKGGCGKTLTVANLGVALASAGHSVAVIDLDLQFGDLALAMGLRPERTMYDLVRSGGTLDSDKLDDYLVEHPSGVRALLAPVSPDQAGLITVPFLREVERLLRERHEFVLIDTPPGFTPEVISATDASSDVIIVAMRDTLSLKNTKLGLETLERMNYDRGHIRIVLNRANTNVGIERQDILAILGRDADVLIPSHRDITRSVNQGDPIVRHHGSAASKAFRALADLYVTEAHPTAHTNGSAQDAPAPKRRFLRRRAR
jgi:pilus assembly protein CpaE